jgi:hypothetical protein
MDVDVPFGRIAGIAGVEEQLPGGDLGAGSHDGFGLGRHRARKRRASQEHCVVRAQAGGNVTGDGMRIEGDIAISLLDPEMVALQKDLAGGDFRALALRDIFRCVAPAADDSARIRRLLK